MSLFSSKKKAFTLIELILVFALIAISSAIVSPIYFSAKNSDDLENYSDLVTSSLRKAQILSMAISEDSSWGVKIENDKIILFKGNQYSSRDISWDEFFNLGKTVKFSGLNEVVFYKLSGRPRQSGDIILQINDGRNSTININDFGLISY